MVLLLIDRYTRTNISAKHPPFFQPRFQSTNFFPMGTIQFKNKYHRTLCLNPDSPRTPKTANTSKTFWFSTITGLICCNKNSIGSFLLVNVYLTGNSSNLFFASQSWYCKAARKAYNDISQYSHSYFLNTTFLIFCIKVSFVRILIGGSLFNFWTHDFQKSESLPEIEIGNNCFQWKITQFSNSMLPKTQLWNGLSRLWLTS